MTPPEIRDHYRRTGRRHLSRFFFNDTATPEIYTLSLHDALPISGHPPHRAPRVQPQPPHQPHGLPGDRKSTRLNSSHANISYAVFCLQKKVASVGAMAHAPFFAAAGKEMFVLQDM